MRLVFIGKDVVNETGSLDEQVREVALGLLNLFGGGGMHCHRQQRSLEEENLHAFYLELSFL